MKKKSPAKKKSAKKAPTRRASSKAKEPHVYVMPKTAAELGVVCSKCGGPAIWFDYELGERNHMSGFVCDAHKVSDRVAVSPSRPLNCYAVLKVSCCWVTSLKGKENADLENRSRNCQCQLQPLLQLLTKCYQHQRAKH
jgi:hypothetical protein